MEKMTKSSPENLHDCLSTKSKSCLNTARLMAPHKQERLAKPRPAAAQPARNFRFGINVSQSSKKFYQKNSDKTIKPPEKSVRAGSNASYARSITSSSMDDSALFIRGSSQISSGTTTLGSREISSVDSHVSPFTRVDTKTIHELEKRLENLQSILLKKVEILKNRCPEKLKREYKFVALVMGEESRLVVKENDVKNFPGYLPAKSLEDLNRKTGEFFIACLLSFVDKLRLYQDEGRSIDCDQIYEDLKNEEKDYCNILQDWINELSDDAERTLTAIEPTTIVTEVNNQETQTEIVEKEKEMERTFDEQNTQTDPVEEKVGTKDKELLTKMDKLRLENYELKDVLTEQKEYYVQEIESIDKKYNEKFTDLMDCWQKEKSEWCNKEEIFYKEQKLNNDLSQQTNRLKEKLNELMEKHENLLSQKREDESIRMELEKLRVEFQRAQSENLELQNWKSHFMKKLDHHYERIELQDKEIRLQKRAIRGKTEELENLKKQFDAKVRENRQNKESLEARNKLIDHLRNAVDIDQKKIREFEILLQSLQKASDEDVEIERDGKLRRFKAAAGQLGRIKTTKRGTPFSADSFLYSSPPNFVQKNEDVRMLQKRLGRPKKKDNALNEQDEELERMFHEVNSTENSSEIDKVPSRSGKPRKRVRDIVVKKYDV